MSSGREEEPFAEIGIPTFSALVDFDRARHGLYDTITESAAETEDISAETREQLRDMTESTTESFAAVAVAVLETDDDLVTKAADLKRLWLEDEGDRASILAGLTDCQRHFGAPKIKHFNRIFKDLLHDVPTIDEMSDEATAIYRESIEADVEDFFNHWDRSCRHGLNLRTYLGGDYEKYLKIAGRQALDVSKIATGVGIGMLIFEKLGGHL